MTTRTFVPFFVMAFGLSWGLAALAIGTCRRSS